MRGVDMVGAWEVKVRDRLVSHTLIRLEEATLPHLDTAWDTLASSQANRYVTDPHSMRNKR